MVVERGPSGYWMISASPVAEVSVITAVLSGMLVVHQCGLGLGVRARCGASATWPPTGLGPVVPAWTWTSSDKVSIAKCMEHRIVARPAATEQAEGGVMLLHHREFGAQELLSVIQFRPSASCPAVVGRWTSTCFYGAWS